MENSNVIHRVGFSCLCLATSLTVWQLGIVEIRSSGAWDMYWLNSINYSYLVLFLPVWLVLNTAAQSQSAFVSHLAMGISWGVAQSAQKAQWFIFEPLDVGKAAEALLEAILWPWDKPAGGQSQRQKKVEQTKSPRNRREPCFYKAWAGLTILPPFNVPTTSLWAFIRRESPEVWIQNYSLARMQLHHAGPVPTFPTTESFLMDFWHQTLHPCTRVKLEF